MHTCMHSLTLIYMHSYVLMCMNSYMHSIHTHMHPLTYTLICMHSHTCTYIHTLICVHSHTHASPKIIILDRRRIFIFLPIGRTHQVSLEKYTSSNERDTIKEEVFLLNVMNFSLLEPLAVNHSYCLETENTNKVLLLLEEGVMFLRCHHQVFPPCLSR